MTRTGFVARRTGGGTPTSLITLSLALVSAAAVWAGPLPGSARAEAGDATTRETIGSPDTAAERRDAEPALAALRELSAGQPIGNRHRLDLVKRAVDGLDHSLPTMHDPGALITYAGQLIAKGIEPDINTIEYWGENPTLQVRIKPAADMAARMLRQASLQAEAQANEIAKQPRAGNQRQADLLHNLDALADKAKYYDNMIAYYRAMATDIAGGKDTAAIAERARICDDAIKYLKDPFDKPGPDGGEVQPFVHNRIGKLFLAKGDYETAKVYFKAIITGKTPDDMAIAPAPNTLAIYEARYFSLVCDVLGKKPEAAEKGLEELEAWQKTTLPADAQSGVDAAADILHYRILRAKADLAGDADKAEFNRRADVVLLKLEKSHPEFTSLTTEQLANRLPENAKLNELSVPVLRALVAKGDAERLKPESVPLDEHVVNRAVRAARELITRKEGVAPREAQDTALLLAILLDRQEKPAEAANAYLDFAANNAADANAGAAVDRAVTLAYPLGHGALKDDPPIRTLYARALSTAASPPWSRKELAYLYADYLRENRKPGEAAAFYRQVSAGDKMEFAARFYGLVAISEQLDDPKLSDADRRDDIANALRWSRRSGNLPQPFLRASRISFVWLIPRSWGRVSRFTPGVRERRCECLPGSTLMRWPFPT